MEVSVASLPSARLQEIICGIIVVQESFKAASNDKVKFSGPVRSGVQGEFPKVSLPEQPSRKS